MKNLTSTEELKNKNVGKITTTVIHLILIALLFLNFFTYPDPPPGKDGIEILNGSLAIISSTENDESEPDEINEEKEKVVPKEIKQEQKPKKQTPKTIDKKVKVDDNSEEIALAKKIREQKEKEQEAQELEEARIQEEKIETQWQMMQRIKTRNCLMILKMENLTK